MYDARNAVALVFNPAGHRLTYAYDPLGARSSLLDPTGRQIEYQYDAGGRLSVLVNTPDSSPAQRSTWSYDPAGRVAENWLGNSTRASYTYDAAGRLVTLRSLRPDNSILSGYHYLLDVTGNRVGVIEATGDRTTWTHDASYQLRSEHRTGAVSFRISHLYDPAGNPLVKFDNGARTTFAYDAANQLSVSDDTSGRTTYSYDTSGNLVVQAAPGGRTTNTWDGGNRLTRVHLPGGLVNTMTYNADGLRTVKEDTSGTTKFVWDNQNVLLETDASNAVQAAYTLSPDRYGKLLDQQRSGVWRYYHYDGIDSTSGLSDTNRQFLDKYVYEAYGKLQSSTGSTVNPFLYVGGLGYYYDSALAQYYVRARHYDPRLARWLSEDPIGYLSKDFNLYRYINDRPVNATDPAGLEQQTPPKRPKCCSGKNCKWEGSWKTHMIIALFGGSWGDFSFNGKDDTGCAYKVRGNGYSSGTAMGIGLGWFKVGYDVDQYSAVCEWPVGKLHTINGGIVGVGGTIGVPFSVAATPGRVGQFSNGAGWFSGPGGINLFVGCVVASVPIDNIYYDIWPTEVSH